MPTTLWKPGQSGNPSGRPKGQTGRGIALAVLDQMLKTTPNQRLLKIRLERSFREDPVKFFKTIVMPLLPKEQLVVVDSQDLSPIRITMGFAPEEAAPRKRTISKATRA